MTGSLSVIQVQVKWWPIPCSVSGPLDSSLGLHNHIMEPGKKRKKVRNAKKKPKSLIKANMTAEQKAEIRIKEKFTESLEIE